MRGNSSFSSGTGRYTFEAAYGVNESGTYTFTATSGTGKTVTKTAPGIHQVTLDAVEGVFQSDLLEEGEELPHTDTWLAARPAAPSLGKSDETIKGKKDGKVTGLTTAMEYSTGGGRTWTAAAGNLTDVPAGKYLVRLYATQTAPRGKTAEAVVGEGRTLTVTFDSQGGSSVSPMTGLTWRVTVAKPADPTKADVAFAGWFKEASCENRWHFASEDAADRVEADITLYAKWLPKAEMPAAVIAYRTETLTGLTPGVVYLIDGMELTASADGSVPIDGKWFGKTISIIKRGNGTDQGDSNPQLLSVPNRPAGPAQVKPKAESRKNGNNGKLTKTDTTMQYRKAGSTEWIPVTGEEVTDLAPGDYEIRYVSTDTAFASEIVVKTVKKYSSKKEDDKKKEDGENNNPGGETGCLAARIVAARQTEAKTGRTHIPTRLAGT